MNKHTKKGIKLVSILLAITITLAYLATSANQAYRDCVAQGVMSKETCLRYTR